MRRMPVMFLLAAVSVVSVAPSWATPTTNHDGTILLPAIAPDLPKRVYNNFGSGSNGTIGYVFRLATNADGRQYTLTRTGPYQGNVDVWFYTDDGGKLGDLCPPLSSEDGLALSTTETGTICPGSPEGAWAMVVLFTGANVSFRLSY